MDTYIFARKINGTEAEGIINTKIQIVLCLCTEKNSKTILQALKISSNLPKTEMRLACCDCGAYHGHSPKCSLMDEKCAKEMLAQYYDVWLQMEMKHRKYVDGLYKKIEGAKKDAEFWKGKFVVVKNENNQLRRKTARQNGI